MLWISTSIEYEMFFRFIIRCVRFANGDFYTSSHKWNRYWNSYDAYWHYIIFILTNCSIPNNEVLSTNVNDIFYTISHTYTPFRYELHDSRILVKNICVLNICCCKCKTIILSPCFDYHIFCSYGTCVLIYRNLPTLWQSVLF